MRRIVHKGVVALRRLFTWERSKNLSELTEEARQLANLYVARSFDSTRRPGSSLVHGITFSMDRALQLHALLSSYRELVLNPAGLTVVYRSSTPEHLLAYEGLRDLVADQPVEFVKEENAGGFREALLDLLRKLHADKVFFLVDDNVFIAAIDMRHFAAADVSRQVPSLRLGLSLRRSYVVNKRQPLPSFLPPESNSPASKETLRWRWSEGQLEWGYPLSLDGHLFDRREFLAMTELIPFHSPNTLEANLQVFNRVFRMRDGICYREPAIVNIPCNKVQTDFPNRHGYFDSEFLLGKWNAGFMIDYKRLRGLKPESTHQEVDLRFVRRTEPRS